MLSKALQAAAGNAGEALFVDSVFSTYLYTGNSSTQTITNGIDLAGEGGMVWVKNRGAANSHRIFDTVRGSSNPSNFLDSASTNAQNTGSTDLITSFNSSGFNLGDGGVTVNSSSNTYASWTFRKAPKFFDVVTYTGDGVAGRTVAHNLGSVPGCIIVKSTSNAESWYVYHRGVDAAAPQDYFLELEKTAARTNAAYAWNDTAPTSTEFTVGSVNDTNLNGATFVAYLFAHDAGGFGADGSENVISCGSFTTDGSGVATVNLGWEPQWILVREPATLDNWRIFDTMRGWNLTTADKQLNPNLSDADSDESIGEPTATGFRFQRGASKVHIYIAIRRPMKPPESGTSVYTASNAGSGVQFTAGFPPDMVLSNDRTGSSTANGSRLIGPSLYLETNTTAAQTSRANSFFWDDPTNKFTNDIQSFSWVFRRAPGFFDVVCYTGTGVTRTVAHNLTVAPELMIIKRRDVVEDWNVYSATTGNAAYLRLNTTAAVGTAGADALWGSTTPTSSVFTVKTSAGTNASGGTFVAYLFATYPGVSKVGSYTGNGSSQTINCGFTSGARFVLIKATSTTGNWIVADSARGINGNTDPALYLNSTAAEVTGFDWIDADSSGFIVNETATIAANTNGVTYIYLAIA